MDWDLLEGQGWDYDFQASQKWDWYLLEWLLPGVDPPVDDQIAAGAEGARAELTDVIALVWEKKKRHQADPAWKNCQGPWDMLWEQGRVPSLGMEMIRERFREQRATVMAPRDGNLGMGGCGPVGNGVQEQVESIREV